MAKGDLHIHTNVSDGAFTPAAVARMAAAGGLDFFAVTDHNSLAGLGLVERAVPADGPRFICGVELSSQPQEGDEIHVLGYGFGADLSALEATCRRITRRKQEQLREMIRRLRQEGVDVDPACVPRDEGDVYVGRPLLAEELVRKGLVRTLNQAFVRYLGRGRPAFVPMRQFNPCHCIEAIHGAGGLAVLAHPTIATVDRWIEPLAAMGLDGVEAYRPALAGNEQLYVEKVAEHFGLFVTGGSDWHGRQGGSPLGAFSVSDRQIGDFFRALGSARDQQGRGFCGG